MIRIQAIVKEVHETDENGSPVTRSITAPETSIPGSAVRTECDGVNYTVYETGD